MVNNEVMENGELRPEEKGIAEKKLVKYTRVISGKRKNNPLKGLVHTIKGIKDNIQKKLTMIKPVPKPLPSYGLGAFPPPKPIKPIPIVRPPVKTTSFYKKPVLPDMNSGTWKKDFLEDNSFFETILMVIIIYFLLKWLFGFSRFDY
ncbi:MAG: hypothetical protein GXW85_03370 [Clostridia bacterium]|nr:hypothetical protein [Clostridia bacterium]